MRTKMNVKTCYNLDWNGGSSYVAFLSLLGCAACSLSAVAAAGFPLQITVETAKNMFLLLIFNNFFYNARIYLLVRC